MPWRGGRLIGPVYNRRVADLLSPSEWDSFLATYPDAHLLQTSAWGELKARSGWQAIRLRHGPVGAQVLLRRLPLGLRLAYVPYGPVGGNWDDLLPAADRLCRDQRVVLLKVEPDQPDSPAAREALIRLGFQASRRDVQPPRTIIVDLNGSESDLLSRMKPKTRYNIQLADRKGVVVQASDDLATFSRLVQATGRRDGFAVHRPDYYALAYRLFHPAGRCELFMAEYAGRPLAGLMAFARGRRAWYLYGASSDAERQRMPTYLLQWHAIRWARERDCATYDLWGVPDVEADELERQFEHRRDGLWGVYRFKRGFGGQIVRRLGSWDRTYSLAGSALRRLVNW